MGRLSTKVKAEMLTVSAPKIKGTRTAGSNIKRMLLILLYPSTSAFSWRKKSGKREGDSHLYFSRLYSNTWHDQLGNHDFEIDQV